MRSCASRPSCSAHAAAVRRRRIRRRRTPRSSRRASRFFRFDTFGDEIAWTDTLRMHEVISAAVDPTTALSVGLKVDADALPAAVVARHPGRQRRPQESGDDGRAAEARRRRRRQGNRRDGQRTRHAHARRHHLRAVPFDGRQFVRAGHRQAARRLAQPRPQSGRDHRALAGAAGRAEGGLQLAGARASTIRASTRTA